MKLKLLFTLLLLILGNFSLARTIDRIVAVVNDDIIMQSELEKMLKTGGKDLNRSSALNKLIDQRLRGQIVKNIGIEVTAEMIDDAINQIASQNNLTLAELEEVLPKEGLSLKSLRAKIKKEIEATIFQKSVLKGKSAISDAELKKQIAKQPKSILIGNSPKYYHVGHILIATDVIENLTSLTEKKNRAHEAINLLKQGKDFSDIAEEYSNSPTAEEGGDLGWRLANDYPQLIADVLPKMKQGQIKGPIKDDSGFHIIKLLETEGGAVYKTYSEAERKQQAMNTLLQKKAEKHISKLLRRYRDEAYIEIKP